MGKRFEELAFGDTAIGEISLRRRVEPTLGVDVFEVRLGEEYLMSSLFTAGEVALTTLGLAAWRDPDRPDAPTDPGRQLDVLVGGLGLGYTAQAALRDHGVAFLVVVEALGEVIRWHAEDLLPDTVGLASDPRTRLVEGNFFELAAGTDGFDPEAPGRRFDAILLDIDHTPSHVLHPSNAPFYTTDGLRRMRAHLQPDGIFALWSDDPPDADFSSVLSEVFARVDAHVVTFPNPLTRSESANTVYVAC